jgi:hypothetical protein
MSKAPFTVHSRDIIGIHECPYTTQTERDKLCSERCQDDEIRIVDKNDKLLRIARSSTCFFFREYQDDSGEWMWYCERVASEEMDFKRKARETMFYEKDDDV